jgi:hypothetical protein
MARLPQQDFEQKTSGSRRRQRLTLMATLALTVCSKRTLESKYSVTLTFTIIGRMNNRNWGRLGLLMMLPLEFCISEKNGMIPVKAASWGFHRNHGADVV